MDNIYKISANCSDCVGASGCKSYCMRHAGRAVLRFVKNLPITESKVGSYDFTDEKNYYKIIGVQTYIGDEVSSNILSRDIDRSVSVQAEVVGPNSTSLKKTINMYSERIKDFVIPNELNEKVNKLDSNKAFCQVFEYGESFLVINADERIPGEHKANLISTKWVADKESGTVECFLIMDVHANGQDGKMKVTVRASDYGKTYRLNGYNKLVSVHLPVESLKITKTGFIRHFSFEGKGECEEIVADNLYVAEVTKAGKTVIIGEFLESGELKPYIDKDTFISKFRNFSDFEKAIETMKSCRKYTLPYLISKETK